MKIKRVATMAMTFEGSGTTYTISFSGGGCNSVFVFIYRVSNAGPTGITYGGGAMTKLTSVLNANNAVCEIWGLNNCLAGTQDILISCNDSRQTRVGAASYSGVSSANTFSVDSDTTKGSPTTSLTLTLTTTVDNCVLVGLGTYYGNSVSAVSAGSGTTQFGLFQVDGESNALEESSPLNVGVAGNHNIQVISGNGADMTLSAIALAPNLSSPNFFKRNI